MKNHILACLIGLLLSTFFFSACKKEPDIPPDPYYIAIRELHFALTDVITGENLVRSGRYRKDSVLIKRLFPVPDSINEPSSLVFSQPSWVGNVYDSVNPRVRLEYLYHPTYGVQTVSDFLFTRIYSIYLSHQDIDTLRIEKPARDTIYFYHNERLIHTILATDETLPELQLRK